MLLSALTHSGLAQAANIVVLIGAAVSFIGGSAFIVYRLVKAIQHKNH